ncbi:hypothetical protein BH10PSE17_BH10PSE17_25670 [soil metagenome]
MRTDRHRSRGFTLIELLVAITILAVVALLSWRGLESVVRARDAVGGEIAMQRGMQAMFGQLDADLRDAARDPASTSSLPGVLFGRGQILLLRQAPEPETGMLRYALVRYRLVDQQIVRESRMVQTPMEIEALMRVPDWPDPVQQILIGNVDSIGWRLWSTQGWRSADGAEAAALATAQPMSAADRPAAAAVELTVQLADGERFVRSVLVRE